MKHLIVFLLCCCSLLVYAQEKREEVAVSDSILLQEVMVKADKKLITLKSDRYVVDATQIRNGKNTLKEVLRDVPGVIVNKENVSIIGKGGLKVMINGRLKQIPDNQISNLLSSYSASEIKKIEVIYHTEILVFSISFWTNQRRTLSEVMCQTVLPFRIMSPMRQV